MAPPSRRVTRLLSALLVAEGAALLGLGFRNESLGLPLIWQRLSSDAVLALAVTVLLLGLLSLRWAAQTTMAAVVSTAGVLLSLAAGYDTPRSGDIVLLQRSRPVRIYSSEKEWTETHHQTHQSYGSSGIPNMVARQVHRDFSVTYRLDAEGWRRLPAPPPRSARGEVWILGCSFTFGAGVEDHETYAYQLASEAWPTTRVRSFAFSGWGTTNAYLVLKDYLSRGLRPDVVLYGWISHHRERNYLRQSWFGPNNAQLVPHFEAEEGRLRWLGFEENAAASWPDGPALDEKEFAVTEALIREMVRLCKEHGIPFVLVVLQNLEDRVTRNLAGEPGLHILDVSRMSNVVYPRDGHPMATWHQAIARGIASNPLLADVTGQRHLLAPEAIADPPMRLWRILTAPTTNPATQPVLAYPRRAETPMRITFEGPASADRLAFLFQRDDFAISKGRAYGFQMRVRSTAARPLSFSLASSRPPYPYLGLSGTIELLSEWQTVKRTFIANDEDNAARLSLALGGSNAPVEVAVEPAIRELSGAAAELVLARAIAPRWTLSAKPGSAEVDYLSDDHAPPLRVRVNGPIDGDIWKIQLHREQLPIVAGEEYTLEIRARATAPRRLEYALSTVGPLWLNLGLWGEAALATSWQTVTRAFVPTSSDDAALLTLAIGGASGPVEVASVRLFRGSRDIIELPPGLAPTW